MSSGPSHIVVQQSESSGLGLAGLIFSIIGWFTCGLLCPIGALLSVMGLFDGKSKALPIAGLIVGLPGVIFLVLFGATMILGVLGLGAGAAAIDSANQAAKERAAQHATENPAESAPSPEIEVEAAQE